MQRKSKHLLRIGTLRSGSIHPFIRPGSQASTLIGMEHRRQIPSIRLPHLRRSGTSESASIRLLLRLPGR